MVRKLRGRLSQLRTGPPDGRRVRLNPTRLRARAGRGTHQQGEEKPSFQPFFEMPHAFPRTPSAGRLLVKPTCQRIGVGAGSNADQRSALHIIQLSRRALRSRCRSFTGTASHHSSDQPDEVQRDHCSAKPRVQTPHQPRCSAGREEDGREENRQSEAPSQRLPFSGSLFPTEGRLTSARRPRSPAAPTPSVSPPPPPGSARAAHHAAAPRSR